MGLPLRSRGGLTGNPFQTRPKRPRGSPSLRLHLRLDLADQFRMLRNTDRTNRGTNSPLTFTPANNWRLRLGEIWDAAGLALRKATVPNNNHERSVFIVSLFRID